MAEQIPQCLVVIAIGATLPRRRIAEEIENALGARFATLLHPRASFGASVSIGPGSIVCAGATASSDISIGRHCQLHAGATLGHDDLLGDFVTIERAGVLHWRCYPSHNYSRHNPFDAIAAVARDQFEADWIIVCDTDEFLVTDDRSLSGAISDAIREEISVLSILAST